MITRLVLTDFMAHSRTELELGPGLTVLCGPNNTGKSAVVEALRCLSLNPAPRHVIRHGAAEARVEAHLDDGWRVAWIRRKTYAIYELTDPQGQTETFAKLGRSGVPDAVAQRLRLPQVQPEVGDAVDVHLGDQRHPIFLLDKPGSVMADFLASSTESAHLMAMQDLLRDKTRKTQADVRRLEQGLAGVRAGLRALERLPDLTLNLEDLRRDWDALERAHAFEPGLEALAWSLADVSARAGRTRGRKDVLDRAAPPPPLEPAAPLARVVLALSGLDRRVLALSARAECLDRLQPPPALDPAAPLARDAAQLADLSARALALRQRTQALSALADPPELAPALALAATLSRLGAAAAQARAARRRSGVLSDLAAPPGLEAAAPLAILLTGLARARRTRAGAQARCGRLAQVAAPPVLDDPAPLAALAGQLAAARQRVAQTRAQIAERAAGLETMAAAVAERLEQVGPCPLCGSDMEAGRFLAGRGDG